MHEGLAQGPNTVHISQWFYQMCSQTNHLQLEILYILKLWVVPCKWVLEPTHMGHDNAIAVARTLLRSRPVLVCSQIKRGHYKIILLVLTSNLFKINALFSN